MRAFSVFCAGTRYIILFFLLQIYVLLIFIKKTTFLNGKGTNMRHNYLVIIRGICIFKVKVTTLLFVVLALIFLSRFQCFLKFVDMLCGGFEHFGWDLMLVWFFNEFLNEFARFLHIERTFDEFHSNVSKKNKSKLRSQSLIQYLSIFNIFSNEKNFKNYKNLTFAKFQSINLIFWMVNNSCYIFCLEKHKK